MSPATDLPDCLILGSRHLAVHWSLSSQEVLPCYINEHLPQKWKGKANFAKPLKQNKTTPHPSTGFVIFWSLKQWNPLASSLQIPAVTLGRAEINFTRIEPHKGNKISNESEWWILSKVGVWSEERQRREALEKWGLSKASSPPTLYHGRFKRTEKLKEYSVNTPPTP